MNLNRLRDALSPSAAGERPRNESEDGDERIIFLPPLALLGSKLIPNLFARCRWSSSWLPSRYRQGNCILTYSLINSEIKDIKCFVGGLALKNLLYFINIKCFSTSILFL